jgi:chromosome segregation ATPase
MFKVYMFVIILGIVGGALYGARYYYESTQATIRQLSAEKAILDQAVERQTAAMEEMQATAAKQNELNQALQAELQEAESGLDEIRSKLSNHDLTKLVLAKPGLIETRINNGTSEAFRLFESDTARPVAE